MRILLTGARGFVGSHIAQELRDRGHSVVAVGRQIPKEDADPSMKWVSRDMMEALAPEDWDSPLENVDAVVNAAGIIRETGNVRFEEVHALAPIALFDSAKNKGIHRIVQISASGVRSDSQFAYFTSKSRADAMLLAETSWDALILRPSLIYGEDGEGTKEFAKLASLPVVPVVGDGSYTFRPIRVEELATIVVSALEDEKMPVGAFEVGGAESLTLKELLVCLRAWPKSGLNQDPKIWQKAPTVSVPVPLMKMVAKLGDWTGHGPLESGMLGMLLESRAADLAPFHEAFGYLPTGLRSYLEAHPPGRPAEMNL